MKGPLHISSQKLAPGTQLHSPTFLGKFGHGLGSKSTLIYLEKKINGLAVFQDIMGWQGLLLGIGVTNRDTVPKKAQQ